MQCKHCGAYITPLEDRYGIYCPECEHYVNPNYQKYFEDHGLINQYNHSDNYPK